MEHLIEGDRKIICCNCMLPMEMLMPFEPNKIKIGNAEYETTDPTEPCITFVCMKCGNEIQIVW